MIKRVVVFENAVFKSQENELDAPHAGRDLAEALLDGLARLGTHLEPPNVIEAEDIRAWVIYLRINRQLLHYAIEWVLLGSPPRPSWSIQIIPRRSLSQVLLRRKWTHRDFEGFSVPLREVLGSMDGNRNIRWLTEPQYYALQS